MLTPRFTHALEWAHHLHFTQMRKGTEIPYISHLMAVSGLVLEHGGTEDQAIAGLLHDAAEDAGGKPTLERIRREFGDAVADIIADCTDAWTEPKPPWRDRKETYIEMAAQKSVTSLLVSLADKTHNAEAIQNDYLTLGEELWSRFNGGADGTRWYYRSLTDVFGEKLPGPLHKRLARAVTEFGG